MEKKVLVASAALALYTMQPSASAREVTYYYTDSQGSVLATADANGTVTSSSDYDPRGRVALGSASSAPSYAGYYGDETSGLLYLGARYYDPDAGVFLSVDPKRAAAGKPSTFNRYAYAANSPYVYTDPDGREIRVSGSSQDVKALERTIYRTTGIKVAEKGGQLVQIGQRNISIGSSAAAGIIGNAIASKAVVSMSLVHDDKNVLIDSFNTGAVDVADLQGMTDISTKLGAATLTHVVSERMDDANHNSGFAAAHGVALVDEASVFGAATRTNNTFNPIPGGAMSVEYLDPNGNTTAYFFVRMDNNATPQK